MPFQLTPAVAGPNLPDSGARPSIRRRSSVLGPKATEPRLGSAGQTPNTSALGSYRGAKLHALQSDRLVISPSTIGSGSAIDACPSVKTSVTRQRWKDYTRQNHTMALVRCNLLSGMADGVVGQQASHFGGYDGRTTYLICRPPNTHTGQVSSSSSDAPLKGVFGITCISHLSDVKF